MHGTLTTADGAESEIDERFVLAPLERALRAMSVAVVMTATAFALARLT